MPSAEEKLEQLIADVGKVVKTLDWRAEQNDRNIANGYYDESLTIAASGVSSFARLTARSLRAAIAMAEQ